MTKSCTMKGNMSGKQQEEKKLLHISTYLSSAVIAQS